MTFQHTNKFIPGDTIRAEPVNAAFDAIAVDLQAFQEDANSRALRFPISKSGGNIMTIATENSFVYIDPTGQLTSYPKATFDSEVQIALNASSAASAAASQASISAYNAKQSEISAAASAEIAQGAAVTVAGATFFAGLWNAATGNFPAAPASGSSMWQASSNGTGATSAIQSGDFILWDLIALTYRHIPGVPRVNSMATLVSNLESQLSYIESLALAGNRQ